MISISDKRRLTLEQAARWFLWLRDNKADPAQVEVFQRWCESSARNRRAYEKVESLWQACNGIDALDLPWPTQLELERDQYDGSYALPLPQGRNIQGENASYARVSTADAFILNRRLSSRVSRRWLHRWGVAASICLAVLLLTLTAPRLIEWTGAPTPYISTDIAQQRMETLPDGSVVTLGGATKLSVRFNKDSREIILDRGEAFFEVAHDVQRPFRVLVGGSEVKAVGTAFNINRRSDAVTISVIEGVVDVSSEHADSQRTAAVFAGKDDGQRLEERLSQGQELVLSREGDAWKAKQGSAHERATAWREGRLSYINERLDRVLQDVNRYATRKVVIGDWELGDLRFTGTVFSNDIEAWLNGLEQVFALRTLKVDDRTVLVRDNSKRT